MEFEFFKMQGTGNDFIVIDNRLLRIKNFSAFAKKYCRRRLSIGADGVLAVEKSDTADFKMRIINADGTEAEMCGNGARCIAMFAYLKGIAKEKMSFETLAGITNAEIIDKENVKVNLNYPVKLELNRIIKVDDENLKVHFINTGVPHTIVFVDDIENFAVKEIGRKIRHHSAFQPAGTNVNFVRDLNHSTIRVRTYERGVEDETLACGTGSVASAIMSAIIKELSVPVKVITSSKEELIVDFQLDKTGVSDIYLTGPVKVVYKGVVKED